jgi:hypothetical protein
MTNDVTAPYKAAARNIAKEKDRLAVQGTFVDFQDATALHTYFQSAYGCAIFPTVGKGGFFIGGSHGKGWVFKQRQLSGSSKMTQVTVGFQAGAQAFSQIIFFEDEAAYDRFTSSDFEFGAQASAVALTEGANASSSTAGGAGAGAGNSQWGGGATVDAESSGGSTPVAGETIGPTITLGAATAPERSAALEEDLAAKLAKFDELMRKAREDAARDRAAAGGGALPEGNVGGGYAGPSGAGGRQSPPPTGSGAGGQSETSSGLGHTPDLTGSSDPGRYRHATGPIPNDIPDARDDDIVARQLREAASRETDPVLQEKLWEEYRKYNKGLGR